MLLTTIFPGSQLGMYSYAVSVSSDTLGSMRACSKGQPVGAQITAALDLIERRDIVRRIWQGDHTVWKSNPEGIVDKLGWLNLPSQLAGSFHDLETFAKEIRKTRYKHIVLLGMGGSSLGADALCSILAPSTTSHPELIILDSVVPSSVASVAKAIDPSRTIFLVSSKSGTTIETNALYRYFRRLVDQSGGTGRNFVAITDAGTPLEALAEKEDFLRSFLNPSNVGGRYSVLSYFGLVVAAVLGIDLSSLLLSAEEMIARCGPDTPLAENPGVSLGAALAGFTMSGHNKLTILTSPKLTSFARWAEQLIAESTGKDGVGILPVVGEPVLDSSAYGDDRVFIYLRLAEDDNGVLDKAMAHLQDAGHRIISIDLQNNEDLAGEFYRWELATAIAGSILGLNPFDQPNVEMAKRATNQMLSQHNSDELIELSSIGSIDDLLNAVQPNQYFAIMAYVQHDVRFEQLVTNLRRRVMQRHKVATTFGYGPRYLHSTGQLHKGGPPTGLFLQIVMSHDDEIEIPGRSYTFGTLVDAQAEGDFRALKNMGRKIVRIGLEELIAQ